jgi:hypothetical protein
MISDDEIVAALAASRGQAELAFVYLERNFRDTLNKNLSKLDDQSGFEASNSYYIEYMNHTIAAAKALELGILQDQKLPSHSSKYDLFERYRDFSVEVDHYSFQMRLAHARHQEKYSVALNDNDKRKIRHYVDQIKMVIDASPLETDKKQALFDRINDFIAELDRDRTRLESFSHFVITLAHTIGEAATELEPVKDLIQSIARVLGLSKEREDSAPRLPPSRTRQIEGPKRDELPQVSKRDDLDDEIPF